MTPDLLAILASVALIIGALCYIILGWQRARAGRNVVLGSGLILLVIGLWLGGVMNLLMNGLGSLVSWWNLQRLDRSMSIALGFAAVGLIVFGIGNAMKPISREEAKQRRLQRSGQAQVTGGDKAQAGRNAGTARTGQQVATSPTGSKISTSQPRTAASPGQAAAAPASTGKPTGKGKPAVSEEDAEIDAMLKKMGI